MQVHLMGGFGEKGRTSVGIDVEDTIIMLDAGIKVGAQGADYYPVLPFPAARIGALLVTHAHEDHVGAMGWLQGQGFRGSVFMTEETMRETPGTLEQYAEAADAARFAEADLCIFKPGDTLNIGGFAVETGRSGHVAGGVWFAVRHGGTSIVYCGDVVPDSPVFSMQEMPRCDLAILDASYGADNVSAAERAGSIADWIGRHGNGCLLPTPLSGRSLELIAAMPGPFRIHEAMRPGLEAQLVSDADFRPGARALVAERLNGAPDWHGDGQFPSCPLLCHDGMGTNGPSARLLPRAEAEGFPILLTGHLPAGSPGDRLLREGRADWIRMPTHPTLQGNLRIWEKAGRPAALGHSCEPAGLSEIANRLPGLSAGWRTGQALGIEDGAVRE